MGRIRLVAAAIGATTLACLGAILWAGHNLSRPAHAPTGLPPTELNATALEIKSAKGQTLSAWFIPGISGRGAVLLLHSIRANKRSMVERARFLKRAGFAMLVVDLQAHGESGGDAITFGAREALDVGAATAKLQSLAPGERLGVIGVSLGTAAFVLSDAHSKYSAVIIESMYPTIGEAVANRLVIRFGSWARGLTPLLVEQLKWRLEVEPARLRPIERVPLISSPVMVIHGSDDRHTTRAEAERIVASITSTRTTYLVEGAAHVDLHRFAPLEYERRVVAFLRHHTSASP